MKHPQICGGKNGGKNQAVESVKQATVAREKSTGILHRENALNPGFKKISKLSQYSGGRRKHENLQPTVWLQENFCPHDAGDNSAGNVAPCACDCFSRADLRR